MIGITITSGYRQYLCWWCFAGDGTDDGESNVAVGYLN